MPCLRAKNPDVHAGAPGSLFVLGTYVGTTALLTGSSGFVGGLRLALSDSQVCSSMLPCAYMQNLCLACRRAGQPVGPRSIRGRDRAADRGQRLRGRPVPGRAAARVPAAASRARAAAAGREARAGRARAPAAPAGRARVCRPVVRIPAAFTVLIVLVRVLDARARACRAFYTGARLGRTVVHCITLHCGLAAVLLG